MFMVLASGAVQKLVVQAAFFAAIVFGKWELQFSFTVYLKSKVQRGADEGAAVYLWPLLAGTLRGRAACIRDLLDRALCQHLPCKPLPLPLESPWRRLLR